VKKNKLCEVSVPIFKARPFLLTEVAYKFAKGLEADPKVLVSAESGVISNGKEENILETRGASSEPDIPNLKLSLDSSHKSLAGREDPRLITSPAFSVGTPA
jgi:hypothetical protein